MNSNSNNNNSHSNSVNVDTKSSAPNVSSTNSNSIFTTVQSSSLISSLPLPVVSILFLFYVSNPSIISKQ